MKLVARLALAQTIPLGLVLVALLGALGALVSMTSLIGDARDDLALVQREQALYGAAWGLDVALRRGADACEQGEHEAVEGDIRRRVEGLEASMQSMSAARPSLLRAAQEYRNFARGVLDSGLCAALTGGDAMRAEMKLDEELTGAWFSGVGALHDEMRVKEDDARRLGVAVSAAAALAALLAVAAVALAARRLARLVTEPLSELSTVARRIGGGDFSGQVPTGGPAEVSALAVELDGMRRRLAELDSLKQGFLASVSHELRTPLAKLREALALLGDGAAGPLSDRQARVVKIARDACEREIRTVSTLLDLGRLQAGSPLRRQGGASLDHIVRAAIDHEAPEAASRGVRLQLESGGEMPTMSLDAPLVERAIANLIRNAISVSPAGKPVVVRSELLPRGEAGRPCARVVVRDLGPGVPAELREQLFTPFVSRDIPSASRPVGVGLGLSLSREIARAHGGDVRLDETSDAGSSFSLWLPVEETTRPASTGQPP